jgi:hypothetical protein
MKELIPVDSWWTAQPIDPMPIYDLGGVLYCAAGWNGEAYTRAFRVLNRYEVDAENPQEVTLRPVYIFQAEGIDLDGVEENSDEWNRVTAFADFDIL